MKLETIAAVLAGLTSGLACDKTRAPTTDVPASGDAPAPSAGEHACGNHAEGACAGDTKAPAADVATTRTFEIAPGKFAEANFAMAKGSEVTVSFAQGSGEIAWDVHSHDHAGGTKIHDEGRGGAGTIEFVAPSDGVFSILWKNTGSTPTPLEANVTLGDGATLHSWIPSD